MSPPRSIEEYAVIAAVLAGVILVAYLVYGLFAF
jgi:hypothetical protein